MPPRVLRCTECNADVQVFEASDTARTDADHMWIEPDAYRCGSCECPEAQDVPVPDLDGLTPAEAQVAQAKATGDAIPFMPEVAA